MGTVGLSWDCCQDEDDSCCLHCGLCNGRAWLLWRIWRLWWLWRLWPWIWLLWKEECRCRAWLLQRIWRLWWLWRLWPWIWLLWQEECLSLATTEDLEAMVVMEAMAMDMVTMARGVPMLSLATTEEDMEALAMVVMEAMVVDTMARGVPMLSLATTEDMEAMVDIGAMVAMEDLDTLVRWILLSLKVKQLANIISVQFCKNMKNISI